MTMTGMASIHLGDEVLCEPVHHLPVPPYVGGNAGGGGHPALDVVGDVLADPLVAVGVVQGDPVEGQLPGQLLLVGPQGADQLEPGREAGQVPHQEAGQGVPEVRPQLVGLAQGVHHQHAQLGGVDPALVAQEPERLKDAMEQGGGGVGVAGGQRQQGLHLGLGLDQLEVGGEGGGLGHLGRHAVHELRHQAGGRVVGLAEVVGHHMAGQAPQVRVGPLVAWPPSLAEAAGLHQGQDDGRLASPGSPQDQHPGAGRQGQAQLLQHLPEEPGPAGEGGDRGAGNLEVQGLQEGGLGNLGVGVGGRELRNLAGEVGGGGEGGRGRVGGAGGSSQGVTLPSSSRLLPAPGGRQLQAMKEKLVNKNRRNGI